jgi:hypothetical protein
MCQIRGLMARTQALKVATSPPEAIHRISEMQRTEI